MVRIGTFIMPRAGDRRSDRPGFAGLAGPVAVAFDRTLYVTV